MSDLVLEKVDEIIDVVKDSKEYQNYQFLFSKLFQNEKANKLIKEVKSLQKQIVKKEVFQESTKDLEKQLDSLVEQLNQIPLYVEFVEKQNELNNLFQHIKGKLNDYFDRILN